MPVELQGISIRMCIVCMVGSLCHLGIEQVSLSSQFAIDRVYAEAELRLKVLTFTSLGSKMDGSIVLEENFLDPTFHRVR